MSGATIGSMVRRARVEANLGLRETAWALGISPATLSRLESGRDVPVGPKVLDRICRELSLDRAEAFVAAGLIPPDVTRWLLSSSVSMRKAIAEAVQS